tara:strand:- start:654 stop:1514 length:861 start_codon:yes stop_codon:yes gene_type:complete
MLDSLNKKLINELESPFHAYLLLGNSSSDLLNQATIFASKVLFGVDNKKEHPDIKIITSENVNTLGVDDIRDVINKDGLVPIEAKYKVVIFPPVKSLTEEASNALLKTLEEPSDSSIFILTSSGKFWTHARDDSLLGILSTIKSRCRSIFIDSDIEVEFNFEERDFINFLESSKREEEEFTNIPSALIKNIESLRAIDEDSNRTVIKIQKLFNGIQKIKNEQDSLNSNRIISTSFEYLIRNLLLAGEFGKKEYRYCELLQDSIDDINKGLRANIVLNNFAIISSKL